MHITLRYAAIVAAAVNVGGGFMFGFSQGYIPVCMQYYTYVTNCTRYIGSGACDAIDGCSWAGGPAGCVFNDRASDTACNLLPNVTRDSCGAAASCFWDSDNAVCEHNAGWTALQQGLLATGMLFGAMIGSFAGGLIVTRLTRRMTIVIAGAICLSGCIVQIAAWQVDIYGVLLAARLLQGLGIGIGSVVSPLYCGEMAPTAWASTLGVLFQTAICGGIFVAAVLGVATSPKNDTVDDALLVTRFQIFNVVSCLTAVAYMSIGGVVCEPTPEVTEAIQALETESAQQTNRLLQADSVEAEVTEEKDVLNDEVQADSDVDDSNRECANLVKQFLVGTAMAVALQLTGMNGIMNFAPKVTSRAGVDPLLGFLLIAIWNFLSAVGGVPIAKKFAPHKIFIVTTAVATAACFIAGVPLYPGVVPNQTVQHVIVWIGLLLYVCMYEFGIGSQFYPIAQAIFPPKYRSIGCSFCLMAQFLLNCVINFGFPIAVQTLAGGVNGDQNEGQGKLFIIFGCIGVVTTAFLVVSMRPVNTSQR
jgi:sugar porter (SP) family MFS transporter